MKRYYFSIIIWILMSQLIYTAMVHAKNKQGPKINFTFLLLIVIFFCHLSPKMSLKLYDV